MSTHLPRSRTVLRIPRRRTITRCARSFSWTDLRLGGPASESGGRSTPSTSSADTVTAADSRSSYIGYLSNVLGALIPKSNPFANLYGRGVPTNSIASAKQTSPERTIVRKTSRSEVTSRTKVLVKKLLHAETESSKILRLQELSHHILSYPPTRVVAVQEELLMPTLLQLAATDVEKQRSEALQCLALCGYVPHVKSRGINMLTIDGGGTRGMMGLEVLEALEAVAGKKTHELFDHIVGVSTGAIIATLLGAQKRSAREAREVYMKISRDLFSQDKVKGVYGLLMTHSYYNTQKWVKILKQLLGDQETLVSTARDPEVPKLSLISCIVNLPLLQPYVFRNYEPPAGHDSHYRGGSQHFLWQAIQASAAAPGYFEEVRLGDVLHQDGGVLANNPTAIGVHEARLLWSNEELNCLVSLGNGRSVQELEPAPKLQSTGVADKLSKIIDSATDTEAVHMTMHDLLSDAVYFRLNPYMSFNYGLDEIDPQRLNQMQTDVRLYMRRNMSKLERAAERLLLRPTVAQKARHALDDWRLRSGLLKA